MMKKTGIWLATFLIALTLGACSSKTKTPTNWWIQSEIEQSILENGDFADLAFLGMGEDPFWTLWLEEGWLSFASSEEEWYGVVQIEQLGDNFLMSGEDEQGNAILVSIDNGTPCLLGEEIYDYNVLLSLSEGTKFYGCAERKAIYADGDRFFKLGNAGYIDELISQLGDNHWINFSDALNYQVKEVYLWYVFISINYAEDSQLLILHHEWNGKWRTVGMRDELSPEDCQNLEEQDPYLLASPNADIYFYQCLE